MAIVHLYITALMVLTAATQQPDTNFTEKSLEDVFTELKNLWNSTSSLVERRAACFLAAENVTAAVSPAPATTAASAVEVAANDSAPLNPTASAEAGITCDSSLLMHYTLAELWTIQFSAVTCQHREKYGEVTGCVLKATRRCWPSDEDQELFPSEDKVKAGLGYLCDVMAADRFNVDVTCAQMFSHRVFSCIRRDTKAMMARNDRLSNADHLQPNLLCRTYDIADLCYWETLKVCGKQTAAAFTRMMSLYFRPPSCSSGSSVSKYNADYEFIIIVFSAIASGINLMLSR